MGSSRKSLCKRLSVLFVVLTLCVSMMTPFAHAASAEWGININKIELLAELSTDETQIAYDGSTTIVNHYHAPAAGYCYAVVTLSFIKNSATSVLDLGDIHLNTGTDTYAAVSDSSFLSEHNYAVFSADTLSTSGVGTIAFEVPVSTLGGTADVWTITCGGVTSDAYSAGFSEIPYQSTELNRQEEIEEAVLSSYEARGQASLADAMIVQDVYGNAPLTAMAFFETDTAATVTVKVHGHTADADITYTVAGETTHHEVPIFGLYPDEVNTVTIAASNGDSQNFSIRTDALPSKIATITPSGSNDVSEIAAGQLYLLQDPYHIIFDRYGEVRWYLASRFATDDCSGIFELGQNRDGFWFSYNPVMGNIYNNCSEVVYIDWMGKIKYDFSYTGHNAHHDATVLPNGHLLYWAKDMMDTALAEIDPSTGEISEYLRMDDLLDSGVGNLNVESFDRPMDYWHANTVEYIADNNSLLISLRNQHSRADHDLPVSVQRHQYGGGE